VGPKQDFGRRLDDASFAGTCGSKKEQVTHRPSRRVQTRAKDLIQIHERLDPLFLAHDFGAQRLMEVTRIRAADARVELLSYGCSHVPNLGRASHFFESLTPIEGQARFRRLSGAYGWYKA
jgi:hypothetical protein